VTDPSLAFEVSAVVVVVAAFVTAFAGAVGYAALVRRRETDRIVRLTAQLAADPSLLHSPAGIRVRDRRLRDAFDRLGERLAETWTLATVDKLTEVLNRQAVLARLEEELVRAGRYGRQLSIVLVDLDHFKRLNDTFGHISGDRVLNAVARELRDNVRSVDVVGRYGGEEFMIILPETDPDAAASLTEKLRRLVGSRQVDLGEGNRVAVTLSAGVAGGSGAHLRLDALVRDADAALYSAKALGRDQVYVFHEIEDDGQIRRAAIAPSAREAALGVGRVAFEAAAETLTAALAERAAWAGRPSTMIVEASMAMARAAGLPEREVDRIRVASLLHDLGKLAIPDEILSKRGELVEPEWRVVAEHPKIGQVVLEQAGALRDAATIVLHHHEWYDGRGYPHGLRGEAIPVGARIVAIADAYEAMVAGRPYRAPIDHGAAIDELRRHSGIQFDPQLVEQFVALFGSEMPFGIPRDGGRDLDGGPDPDAQVPRIAVDVDLPSRARPPIGRGVPGWAAAPTGASDAAAIPADASDDHAAAHDRLDAKRRRAVATEGAKARPSAAEGDLATGTGG
jgi:diguanylate cyclase (GGDEF)-like protein